MKKLLLIIVLMLLSLSFALGSSVFLKDIGFSFGHANFFFDKYESLNLGMYNGLTFGLTQKLDCQIGAVFALTPYPYADVSVGIEFNYCFLGERVFDRPNAGVGINSMISVGLYANNHNQDHRFLPTILMLKITPLTVGSPASGKRERLLPIGVAYNFYSKQFSLFLSCFVHDFYSSKKVLGRD